MTLRRLAVVIGLCSCATSAFPSIDRLASSFVRTEPGRFETALADGRAIIDTRGVQFQFHGGCFGLSFEHGSSLAPEGIDPSVPVLNDLRAGTRFSGPAFLHIQLEEVYPGVSILFTNSGGALKADYRFHAGASIGSMRIRYRGVQGVRVDDNGNLLLSAGNHVHVETIPAAYQEREGRHIPVTVSYRIHKDGSVGFAVRGHDPGLDLVIDPVVDFVYRLGASSAETGTGVVADADGNIYIAGWTDSSNFGPVSARGVDAFVAKLDSSAQTVLALTLFGGRGDDRAAGITIDSRGHLWVTGTTHSLDFPIVNGHFTVLGGSQDGFVVELSTASLTVMYSSFLGGPGLDAANAVTAGLSGDIFIAGESDSATVAGAITPIRARTAAGTDAFVVRLDATGMPLWQTFLGGRGTERATAAAVDATGDVYVTGATSSVDFPVLNGFQSTLAGLQNVFVVKLNGNSGSVVYGSYLGGSGASMSSPETALSIAVDTQGRAYIAGLTSSVDFPIVNAYQTKSRAIGSAAFVSAVAANGSSLVFSTYLAGVGSQAATAVRVNPDASVTVGGWTTASDFPVQPAVAPGGLTDAFVSVLSADGSVLQSSTRLAGEGDDEIAAISPSGPLVVVGSTTSRFTAISSSTGGAMDVLVSRVGSGQPFGSVDTPADYVSVTGAIGITGWAVAESGIQAVKIWRDPVCSESANQRVYVGKAAFVAGARPDIMAAFPTYTSARVAGWGLQVLTNMLPSTNCSGTGDGSYVFHVTAESLDGRTVEIGTKHVTTMNSRAAKPFGTLDTPGQGETISGSAYVVFGWALTPAPYNIAADGSTITVYIDGAPVGHPVYNQYRSDIASLFPAYANSKGAVGYYILDTTRLANGVHSIAWSVTDNAGRIEGIGSRMFLVAN